MIEVENKLVPYLNESIKDEFGDKYPDIMVYSEYTNIPRKLPAVMIEEVSNIPYMAAQTNDSIENYVIVGYQIDIYASGTNKKKIAKEIATYIDNLLTDLKFMRDTFDKMSNVEDTNIYRIVARYSAVIGKDNIVYTM